MKLLTASGEVWSYLPEEYSYSCSSTACYTKDEHIGSKGNPPGSKVVDHCDRAQTSKFIGALEFLRTQLAEEGMDVDAEIAALEPNYGDDLEESRALYGGILGILILILGGAAIVVIYLSERINVFETLPD